MKNKHSFHYDSAIHSRAGSSPIRKRLVPPPGGGQIYAPIKRNSVGADSISAREKKVLATQYGARKPPPLGSEAARGE